PHPGSLKRYVPFTIPVRVRHDPHPDPCVCLAAPLERSDRPNRLRSTGPQPTILDLKRPDGARSSGPVFVRLARNLHGWGTPCLSTTRGGQGPVRAFSTTGCAQEQRGMADLAVAAFRSG